MPEEEDPVPDEPLENKQEEVLQSLDDVAPPSSEQVATIANVVPEPVENAPIETPPPTKKEMEKQGYIYKKLRKELR